MAKPLEALSVFLPAYNEEANLEKTARNVLTNLQRVAEKYELIIINDGSRDRTIEIARQLADKNQSIRVVDHQANRGYGAALKSGLYAARYPWIAFIDADGQFNFAEIDHFIKTQQQTNADLVIGYYRRRHVSFIRKINSFAWQVVVFLLFGLRVRDIDCGFKLIRKKVIDDIDKLESERGAFITSEFLIKVKKSGFKIVEIPVTHYPRLKGEATGAKLNVVIKSFTDLFRLWKKLR